MNFCPYVWLVFLQQFCWAIGDVCVVIYMVHVVTCQAKDLSQLVYI